jgi:nuclear pore complex protein Nup155
VYEGLCIFLANALQPVWHEYICSSRDPDGYQRLALHTDTLNTCRERTRAFVTFLEQFDPDTMLPWDDDESAGHRDGKESARPSSGVISAAYHGQGGVNGHAGAGSASHAHHQSSGAGNRTIQDRLYGRTGLVRMKKSSEARRAEVGAIYNIKQLAMRSSEALGFISILSDHQLHRIMPALQGDIREELARMQFCDLVARVPGATISTALIEVLFSGLSSVQDDLQPLCKLLQNICPSYFDDDDMTLQNGLQRIRAAAELAGAVQPSESFRIENGIDRYGVPAPDSRLLDIDATGSAERDAAVRMAEEAVALLKPLTSRIYNVESVCAQVAAIGAIPSALELAIAVGDCAEAAGDKARTTQSYECAIALIEGLVVMQSSSDQTGAGEGRAGARNEVPEDGLGYNDDSGLSPEQKHMKDAALRVAFSSKSHSFVDMLFSSLAQSTEGQRELMVRPSPRLENFLGSHQLRDLLWKYFARQGRHADAAGVLIAMAEEDSDATLMERLGYLSRALHNAKTAAAAGDMNAGTLDSDVKDYLDVARVQLKIREEISRRSAQLSEVASVLSELDSKILDLTVLYNEYTIPYGLLECTLEILRCGSYRDDKQVRGLWIKIIDAEIAESRSPALLEQKVIALGREFYPSDVVFPTRFIVDLLERRTFEKAASSDSANGMESAWSSVTGWVTNAMVAIGVPLGEIVDGYRAMIENSSQPAVGAIAKSWSWTDEQSQLHVILAAEHALAAWADRAERGAGSNDMERRILVAESEKALRTVALCKSRLRGMSNTRAKSLVQRFDKIEASLQHVENTDWDYF